MHNLGFYEERGSIRPNHGVDRDHASILLRVGRLDLGERTRPGDARGANIAELVANSGVKCGRSYRRFPFSIRRAWRTLTARLIALVWDLKRTYRAANVDHCGSLDRVLHHYVVRIYRL